MDVVSIVKQLTVIFIVLIPFIVTLAIFKKNDGGDLNRTGLRYSKASKYPDPDGDFTWTLSSKILVVDPVGYSLRLVTDYTPSHFFYSLTDAELAKDPFTIGVGEGAVSLKTTHLSTTQFNSQTLFEKGSFTSYPFDSYSTTVIFYVYGLNTDNISLSVELDYLDQYAWSFSMSPEPVKLYENTSNVLVARVNVSRTVLFQLYPVFQIIAFWLVTCSLFYYGSSVLIWKTKNIDPPIAGMVMGLLFALPSFRNTAPAAPPIGCLLDFASFFWAMLSVIIFGVGVFSEYTLLGKPAPPKPPPQTATL